MSEARAAALPPRAPSKPRLVTVDSLRTLDPVRWARAGRLKVEALGEGRFRVSGGGASHLVTLGVDGQTVCDCEAAKYRPEELCTHVVAAARYYEAESHPAPETEGERA